MYQANVVVWGFCRGWIITVWVIWCDWGLVSLYGCKQAKKVLHWQSTIKRITASYLRYTHCRRLGVVISRTLSWSDFLSIWQSPLIYIRFWLTSLHSDNEFGLFNIIPSCFMKGSLNSSGHRWLCRLCGYRRKKLGQPLVGILSPCLWLWTGATCTL